MYENIFSNDGRYAIYYRKDLTGYAQVVEYAGFAPRLEISRSVVPFDLIGMLMDKMLFNLPAVAEIVEPHAGIPLVPATSI
jgi:hypothetical protein